MKKITLFIFTLMPSLFFSQVILQDEFESTTDVTAGSSIFGFSSSASASTAAPSARVLDLNATGNFYYRHWLNETNSSTDTAKIFDTDGTTDGVLRTAGFGTVALMDITNPKTATIYAKPTKLKMTVAFDCGALTTNGDFGRGVLVGYYKSLYVNSAFTATSFTDANNGITYNTTDGNLYKNAGTGYNPGQDFFGFIVNADTGQINLWNGQSSKGTATNAYQAYIGTWSGGTTKHTISYVVDTVTGALTDFVFDGVSTYSPWTTTQFPAATFPVFTNANTNFVGIGAISSAGTGNANFYSFQLENATTLKVDAATFNENNVAVYKNNGVLVVNSSASTINNIKVFDIQGRLIVEQKNVNDNSAAIKDLKANKQVLIVKVTLQDNKVVSKKVVN